MCKLYFLPDWMTRFVLNRHCILRRTWLASVCRREMSLMTQVILARSLFPRLNLSTTSSLSIQAIHLTSIIRAPREYVSLPEAFTSNDILHHIVRFFSLTSPSIATSYHGIFFHSPAFSSRRSFLNLLKIDLDDFLGPSGFESFPHKAEKEDGASRPSYGSSMTTSR